MAGSILSIQEEGGDFTTIAEIKSISLLIDPDPVPADIKEFIKKVMDEEHTFIINFEPSYRTEVEMEADMKKANEDLKKVFDDVTKEQKKSWEQEIMDIKEERIALFQQLHYLHQKEIIIVTQLRAVQLADLLKD